MILLDKLSQRRPNQNIQPNTMPQESPLPTYNQGINQPVKPLTTTPMYQRISSMPQRGVIGSMPNWGGIQKRFVADLPANIQLQGIQSILSGQETQNPIINNFVKGMAAQGKTPEEIRQAFIAHQKQSNNPLVLM